MIFNYIFKRKAILSLLQPLPRIYTSKSLWTIFLLVTLDTFSSCNHNVCTTAGRALLMFITSVRRLSCKSDFVFTLSPVVGSFVVACFTQIIILVIMSMCCACRGFICILFVTLITLHEYNDLGSGKGHYPM